MILVTGATGTVGSALLAELAGRDDVRALVRDAQAAERVSGLGAQPVAGSFEDPGALRRAMAGVERVFLLSPPGVEGMVEQQVAVAVAAREAGVRHVVKLSSIGADEDGAPAIVQAHAMIERHIESLGLEWTHLRPHWFMQNELGQAGSIAAGAFYAPDVGAIAAIDARDIAAVAARVLTEDGHEGRAYLLTGPEPLSYADVARVYERVLGHPVRWIEVTPAQARDSMREGGLPDELATGFAQILARYREGGVMARVSGDVERLLGRPPRSFEAFVAGHAEAFGAAPVAMSC